MQINLVSGHTNLAADVAKVLQGVGSDSVTLTATKTAVFQLRHNPSVAAVDLARLRKALRPLEPEVVADDTLTAADAEIHLGDARPLTD